MSQRVTLPMLAVVSLLFAPLVVRGLDGPAQPKSLFFKWDGLRRNHTVDTAIDYPPPIEPLLGDGGLGGGLGGLDPALTRGHYHWNNQICGWRCRVNARIRKGEAVLFEKPEGLDGYECDLEQALALESAAARGFPVYERRRYGSGGESSPEFGRVEVALRGLRSVPPERTAYFSWLWTTSLVVDGWSGDVIDVKRVPKGFRIRVEVSPSLPLNLSLVPVDYVETYLLHDDGRMEYLSGGGKPEYRGRCVVESIH